MKKLLLIAPLLLTLASCTTRVATEEKKEEKIAASENLDRQTLDAVLRCINDGSAMACSLNAEGSITLGDGDGYQCGHFDLKSKRLVVPSPWLAVAFLTRRSLSEAGIGGGLAKEDERFSTQFSALLLTFYLPSSLLPGPGAVLNRYPM